MNNQKVKKGLPKRTGKEQMKRMATASHARLVIKRAQRVAAQRKREERNQRLCADQCFTTKTQRRRWLDDEKVASR